MKIAILVKNYRPPWNEGVKKNIHNISCGLKQNGHTLFFLGLSDRSGCHELGEGKSFLIKSFFYNTPLRYIFYPAGILMLIVRGTEILKRERPHIFIVSFGTNVFVASLLKVLSGVNFKIVQFFYSEWYSFQKVPLRVLIMEHLSQIVLNNRILTRLNLRHCDLIIATTVSLRKELRHLTHNNSNIIFIPTGVDTVFFQPGNEERKKYPEKLVVAFIGHLTYSKGFGVLIEAMMPLLATLDMRLIVAISHSGAESRILSKLRLFSDKITVWGTVDPRLVYNGADIVVYPLRYPFGTIAYPNIVLEAMACARPIVVTGFYGVKELIQDKVNGFLLKKADASELRDTIVGVYKDMQMLSEVGARARQKVIDELSWPKIISQIDTAIKKLYDAQ